jgi:hypothetical protein
MAGNNIHTYAVLVLVDVDHDAWTAEYGTGDDSETTAMVMGDLTDAGRDLVGGIKWNGLAKTKHVDIPVYVAQIS